MATRSKYLVPESTCYFLTGPGKLWYNLTFCLKAMFGFWRGFRALHFCGPSVCVVGSVGHLQPSDYYNKCAEGIGAIIAHMGLTTITSGRSRLMTAVNKGAYNGGGHSVSCNIPLKDEDRKDRYLHEEVKVPYFFVRKLLLIKYSYACIVMPGDIGTLDELFEMLNLMQAAKSRPFPVIVFGKKFYAPIREQLDAMNATGALQINGPAHLFFTDSLEEIEYILQEYVTGHVKPKDGYRTGSI